MTFGIIGTNFISDSFLAALPFADARAVSVYSRKRETGKAFAERHGIPYVFDDMEAFLSSDTFDAVYIASPNYCHEEQSTLALLHGKHVLCEKPIAPSHKAYLRMQAVAKKAGCVLMEAMRPHHDSFWKEIIKKLPLLGNIRGGQLDYCQYSSRYDRYKRGEYTNAFDPALSNAALLDIGIYPLAAAVMLFGAPQSVTGKSVLLPTGFEGAGTAVLDYGTHTVAVSYSKIADSVSPSVIIGEAGGITIDKMSSPTKACIRLRTGEEILLEKPETDAPSNMHEEVLAFSAAVKAGELLPCGDLSLAALTVMDELRMAAGVRFPSDKEDALC